MELICPGWLGFQKCIKRFQIPRFKELNKLLFFLDSRTFICDFHREKAWMEWTSKIDNGVTGTGEECLGMLRKIAHAQTMDDYKEALSDFQSSQLFKKNQKLSRWFTSTWLPEAEVCI
jgi:hypothetical protein